MKMVMSADSSDCHSSSSSSSVAGAEAPTQSAKISVICHITNQTATPPQHLGVVEASPASSTTAGPQIVMGRSHLENALKLPPNTSVSAYYQNTKLLTQNTNQNSSNMEQQQQTLNNYQNSHNLLDYQNRHINFLRTPLGATTQSANSSTPVTDMDTVPTGASSASTSASTALVPLKLTSSSSTTSSSQHHNSSPNSPSSIIYNPKSSHNSLILSQALQQPNMINATNIYHQTLNNNNIVSTSENLNSPSYDNFLNYHHSNSNVNSGMYQQHHHLQQHPSNMQLTTLQHQHSSNSGVVVVAADSRPQTPDYIKSYPVMDTTVASSVKGEPELNIGKM